MRTFQTCGVGVIARTEAAWGATLAARVPLLVLVAARTAGASHAGADAEDLRGPRAPTVTSIQRLVK